ncbi:MAG: hypothetical protein Q8W51_10465 [Candidatus Palauibacterales bacterium]|nr:hypothetical protein [Candidatus Palauibacterales bacterium]MDP2530149.1 hypothetical protein [Candidatus Palauibacterales bacterium]MDP2582540.1 hypothetical protein [Candidatus Palauibacterales bacterium]
MPTWISLDDSEDRAWRILKVAGLALLGAGAVTALGAWLARDQMVRHRKDLFSPHPLRRLAALGYLRSHPDVDNVLLLRDFLAWEERPLLRRKASGILEAMEDDLAAAAESAGGA